MPSGGHARSGPLRDPNALRRLRPGDGTGWVDLPAEGRTAPAPAWPLAEQPTEREAQVWAQFWAKPQAIIWERDQIFEPVAMFVRQYIEGMVRKASAENRKTVRMMFADLYLTSDSMIRAKLRIVADEVGEKRTEKAEPRKSSRSRLKVVVPDADGA